MHGNDTCTPVERDADPNRLFDFNITTVSAPPHRGGLRLRLERKEPYMRQISGPYRAALISISRDKRTFPRQANGSIKRNMADS
jgi:hypothetical protein